MHVQMGVSQSRVPKILWLLIIFLLKHVKTVIFLYPSYHVKSILCIYIIECHFIATISIMF
jgi:hypothetical protein